MEIGSLYVDRLLPRSAQFAHSAQVVVSERMLEKVKMCEIRSEIYGASDHCPIVLEIEDTIETTDDAKTEDTIETAEPEATESEAAEPNPA